MSIIHPITFIDRLVIRNEPGQPLAPIEKKSGKTGFGRESNYIERVSKKEN